MTVAAAGLAGCATDYVPPPPVNKPGPEALQNQAYRPDLGPGMLGDLRWNIDLSDDQRKTERAAVVEQEQYKKWRESMSASERQEFDDWRAWQDWKRKNPK